MAGKNFEINSVFLQVLCFMNFLTAEENMSDSNFILMSFTYGFYTFITVFSYVGGWMAMNKTG